MALLTAEDVLNKAFSKTKYREGFDQDEVDDFLDEVANAISALTAERDELQARLAQYQAGGVPAAAADSGSAGTSSASADLLSAATDPNPPSATTMLSMAQRLHDDYVQAGEAERERIIDEGKAKAESIVEQAETDARVRMQSLDAERADLERRIDDLRRFERDYRGHLRNYLENLLGDLEHNSARGGVGAPGAEAPTVAPEPPLFAGAFGSELPPVTQEPTQEPTEYQSVEPQAPFGADLAPVVAPLPAIEDEIPSRDLDSSEVAPLQTFPEPLPPFPGSSQEAKPFDSPFKDANPFAPSVAQGEAQAPDGEFSAPAAPTLAEPEDEAPRWNF
ncbi:MAG: DivIVA domain-containing protein [Demequinaceae bacterium]|nr:DivIVA domain-containing protein [Demequinaceae bacterium]